MSEPCQTCSPATVCPDPDDPFGLYNVATEFFPFVFECPDEVNQCPPLGVPIYLNCCGTLLSDTLPFNSTPEETQAAFQRLFARCAALHPSCSDPPGPPVPPPPNPVQPVVIYGNHQQTATVKCALGGITTYTSLAGRFFALSQASADAAAYNYAVNQASILFSNTPVQTIILPEAMKSMPYSAALNALHIFPATFTLTAGSLPPGMTLNPTTGILSGRSTVTGTYNFTIQCIT